MNFSLFTALCAFAFATVNEIGSLEKLEAIAKGGVVTLVLFYDHGRTSRQYGLISGHHSDSNFAKIVKYIPDWYVKPKEARVSSDVDGVAQRFHVKTYPMLMLLGHGVQATIEPSTALNNIKTIAFAAEILARVSGTATAKVVDYLNKSQLTGISDIKLVE